MCGKYFTVDRVSLLGHKLGASNIMEFNLLQGMLHAKI